MPRDVGSRAATAAVASAAVSCPGAPRPAGYGPSTASTADGMWIMLVPRTRASPSSLPRASSRVAAVTFFPSSLRRSALLTARFSAPEYGQRLQHLDVELVQRFHRPPHGGTGVQPPGEHRQIARRRHRQVGPGAQQCHESAVVPRSQPVQGRGHPSHRSDFPRRPRPAWRSVLRQPGGRAIADGGLPVIDHSR